MVILIGLHMPENIQKTSSTIRLLKIQKLFKRQHQISISDLASMFNVSEMTIRRDLDKLERGGHVRRTTGGAMIAERMIFEFDFLARRQTNRKNKRAIAVEASKLVQSSQRIIIDTGTTTLELAQLLKNKDDITIITPSLAIASELQFCANIQTILLGGIVRPSRADLTGAVTETTLDMFSVDIVFQGTDGIGLDGSIYNHDIRLVRVEQKMRLCAAHTYILADSSKIGKTALARGGSLPELDALITDTKISPAHYRALKDLGVNIILADVKGKNEKWRSL